MCQLHECRVAVIGADHSIIIEMHRILYLYTHNNSHVTILCSHSTCIVHH